MFFTISQPKTKQDTIIMAQAPFLSVSYLWSIMIKPVYVYEIYGYRLYNSSNIGIVYQTYTILLYTQDTWSYFKFVSMLLLSCFILNASCIILLLATYVTFNPFLVISHESPYVLPQHYKGQTGKHHRSLPVWSALSSCLLVACAVL